MQAPRLEQIFREETRRALGADRMTVERLIEALSDFVATATPDETAVLGRFLRGLASVVAPQAPSRQQTPLETAKSAVSAVTAAAEAFRAETAAHVAPGSPIAVVAAATPLPTDAPGPTQRVSGARPFRVPYPAPIRGRAPEPAPLPGPDPSTDDIEDFTATGS